MHEEIKNQRGNPEKVLDLFKELLDEMKKLTRIDYEILLGGLELASVNARKEKIRKLREEEKQNG